VVDADCDVRTWEITAYLRPSPWWWPARLHRLSPERVGVAIGDRPVTNEVSDQPGLAHGDA
jgi:hypothetical protein